MKRLSGSTHDQTRTMILSRRRILTLASAFTISGGCQMSGASRAETETRRNLPALTTGPAYDRAKIVFDRLKQGGVVFTNHRLQLTVFEGMGQFPIFVSDAEIAIESGAINAWPESAQLAALFVSADVERRYLNTPERAQVFVQDRTATESGFDLASVEILAQIGFDPRAMLDVRRARVDVTAAQIAAVEAKLKSIGYQV